MRVRNRAALTCVAVLFGMMIPAFSCGAEPPPASKRDVRPSEETVAEAVAKIRETAFTEPSVTEIARIGLREYLRKIDPYSDFLPRNEFEQFRKMKRDGLFGVGMDIERDAHGRIHCMPHPGGPAEKAGVRFGDILTAVDGVDVMDRSLLFAASFITGGPGKVALSVRDTAGKTLTATVSRVKLTTETVEKTVQGKIPVLRISSFETATPRELRHLLTGIPSMSPLIIDIRQNHGGDLYAAIESAMLFLPRDRDVVTVQKKREVKKYRSYGNAVCPDSPLFLWQDRETASAAEVFLAALVQNRRAVSIGFPSFGKGVTQDVIELSDGSGMILTSGYLVTPDGNRYHGKGIAPFHALPDGTADREAYGKRTGELLAEKRHPATAVETPPRFPASPSPVKPEPEKASPDFFLCFDKEFETEPAAQEWMGILERSLRLEGERYLFQRSGGDGIRFFPCLGPYGRKERADKERLRLSKAVIVPMFIRTGESLAVEPVATDVPGPSIPDNGGPPSFP